MVRVWVETESMSGTLLMDFGCGESMFPFGMDQVTRTWDLGSTCPGDMLLDLKGRTAHDPLSSGPRVQNIRRR